MGDDEARRAAYEREGRDGELRGRRVRRRLRRKKGSQNRRGLTGRWSRAGRGLCDNTDVERNEIER